MPDATTETHGDASDDHASGCEKDFWQLDEIPGDEDRGITVGDEKSGQLCWISL